MKSMSKEAELKDIEAKKYLDLKHSQGMPSEDGIVVLMSFRKGWDNAEAYYQSRLKEELRLAFNAGKSYQRGYEESERTYNKFTGFQKPNTRPNFDEWLKLKYK